MVSIDKVIQSDVFNTQLKLDLVMQILSKKIHPSYFEIENLVKEQLIR